MYPPSYTPRPRITVPSPRGSHGTLTVTFEGAYLTVEAADCYIGMAEWVDGAWETAGGDAPSGSVDGAVSRLLEGHFCGGA